MWDSRHNRSCEVMLLIFDFNYWLIINHRVVNITHTSLLNLFGAIQDNWASQSSLKRYMSQNMPYGGSEILLRRWSCMPWLQVIEPRLNLLMD